KKTQLTLLGAVDDPAYLRELKAEVKKLSLDNVVTFARPVANPHPYYEQADIVVVPSSNEAFGRVTVEAMLHGKPVVGSNKGGTAEIIEDNKTGLLYTAGDSQALAEKIAYLLDHPESCTAIGQAAQQAAGDYTAENYGYKLYDLLTKHQAITSKKWLYETLLTYAAKENRN